MNELKLLKNGVVLLVITLCFSRDLILVKGAYVDLSSTSETREPDPAATNPHDETESDETAGRTTTPDYRTQDVPNSVDESAPGSGQELANLVKKSAVPERLDSFFNAFAPFGLFPFLFPSFEGDAFHLNGSERTIPIERATNDAVEVRRETRKPKPFFFIDFDFNMREVPLQNRTDESNSLVDSVNNVAPLPEFLPHNPLEGIFDPRKEVPSIPIDGDWPFIPRDPEEFIPKPDLFFFDFPFLKRSSRKVLRTPQDNPGPKNEINFIMDIFDDAMSRTKRQLDETSSLWELPVDAEKSESHPQNPENQEKFVGSLNDRKSQDSEKHRGDKRTVKSWRRSPYDPIHHKNPVILGEVVKIGTIHFGGDYPKGKKKRSRDKKAGHRGPHEVPVELQQGDEPNRRRAVVPSHMDFGPVLPRKVPGDSEEAIVRNEGKAPRGAQAAKIMDLIAKWDRKEMEDKIEGKAPPEEKIVVNTRKGIGEFEERSVDGVEGFRYKDHFPKDTDPAKDTLGFEVMKPQPQLPRTKKQGNADGGVAPQENARATKDEVKRKIRHVLGQFFSMVKSLGENEKDNQEKEMPEEHRGQVYVKDTVGKMRRTREAEMEDRGEKPRIVPDLMYLFLTVTLPTMLAFTLLIVVCFFNLRVRGWLCTKLFQPRHVYVVEGGDTGKGIPELVKPIDDPYRLSQKATDDAYKRLSEHEKRSGDPEYRSDGGYYRSSGDQRHHRHHHHRSRSGEHRHRSREQSRERGDEEELGVESEGVEEAEEKAEEVKTAAPAGSAAREEQRVKPASTPAPES